jgi:hypothetical protein
LSRTQNSVPQQGIFDVIGAEGRKFGIGSIRKPVTRHPLNQFLKNAEENIQVYQDILLEMDLNHRSGIESRPKGKFFRINHAGSNFLKKRASAIDGVDGYTGFQGFPDNDKEVPERLSRLIRDSTTLRRFLKVSQQNKLNLNLTKKDPQLFMHGILDRLEDFI